jgi:hypothetical protein
MWQRRLRLSTFVLRGLSQLLHFLPMKANLILVILSFCTVSAVASEQSERLDARLRIAEQLSSLTAEGSTPLHLKLTSTEIRHGDPEGNTEIEVWWANTDRWRREVKSSAFSQTTIPDGTRYYESNGGEYLPWWLDQLIRKSVDPIPASEVTGANDSEVEFANGNCARWQSHYAKGPAQIEITDTICFNPDGTLRELFTRTAGVQFSDYRYFGDKRIARILMVWPQPAAELKATINILEALQQNTEMFAIRVIPILMLGRDSFPSPKVLFKWTRLASPR